MGSVVKFKMAHFYARFLDLKINIYCTKNEKNERENLKFEIFEIRSINYVEDYEIGVK